MSIDDCGVMGGFYWAAGKVIFGLVIIAGAGVLWLLVLLFVWVRFKLTGKA